MSILTQRKQMIIDKVVYQRNQKTLEERIQYTLTFTKWLLYIQGGLYFILAGVILVLGIGSIFDPILLERWEKAGLIAVFSLTYSLHASSSLIQRRSLQHLLRLPEANAPSLPEEAQQLNQEARQILYGRNWGPLALLIPLSIIALLQILLETLSFWTYLGPVYALAVILLSLERINVLKKLSANFKAFEEMVIPKNISG